MKKLLSMVLVVFVLGLTLVACNDSDKPVDCTKNPDHEDCQVDKDAINPILKVTPTEVTIMFEENYDFMAGVEATDNIDGNIASNVTIDKGDFDNKVAGQYEIKYSVKDSSGNEAKATRTITVLEKMSSIVVDGTERYGMVYNPILNPKVLMGDRIDDNTNFPWHFDLTKVGVFSKVYFNWLYENYGNRVFAGWSNVAVTDADGKIILFREFTTTEYDADGSRGATDWSEGSLANDYKDNHAGLANLPGIIPDGGHVVVFINDGANNPGSPRSFGDIVLDNGAGIGKTITFAHKEVIVDHETNQLPVITVPEADFEREVVIGSAFDIMTGVNVSDKEDQDVTLETKIYKLVDGDYVVVDAVTTDAVAKYVIEYSANYDDVRKVTVRRIINVVEQEDKSFTFGNIQIPVVVDPDEWASYYGIKGAVLYTKEFWATIDQSKLNGINENCIYQYSVVVVLDKFGTIVEIRDDKTNTYFNKENPAGIENVENNGVWELRKPTIGMNIPDGGYVLAIYPDADAASFTEFYKAFVDLSGDTNELADHTGNAYAIGEVLKGEWFSDFVQVGDDKLLVAENPDSWPKYYEFPGASLYTKEFWGTIDQTQLVYIDADHMYQNGVVIVLDANGKVIEIRDDLNKKLYNEDNPAGVESTWAVGTPTVDLVVPDGGYVLAMYPQNQAYSDAFRAALVKENVIGKTVDGKWFPNFIQVGDDKLLVAENPDSWNKYYELPGASLYTKNFWSTIDQTQLVYIDADHMYQNGVVIVLDANGKVIEIRDDLNDGKLYNAENPAGVERTWAAGTPTVGLVVPDGGYVLAMFPQNQAYSDAFRAALVKENVIGKTLDGKWFPDYIKVGESEIEVVKNTENWRSYYSVNGGHLYTKAFWDSLDQTQLNGEIPDTEMYRYSLLVILDENGKVVEIRDGLSGTHFTAENPTGTKDGLAWTRTTPTVGLVVPDGGYVLAFTQINNTDNTWRTAAYQMFVHTSGDHSGLYNGTVTADITAVGNITVTLPE